MYLTYLWEGFLILMRITFVVSSIINICFDGDLASDWNWTKPQKSLKNCALLLMILLFVCFGRALLMQVIQTSEGYQLKFQREASRNDLFAASLSWIVFSGEIWFVWMGKCFCASA